MAAAKAFERYFYDFSLHELWAKQYPPFPTIGMCPNGWKGTWVCEADKHKAMEMYTVSKLGMEEREEGSPPLNPSVLSWWKGTWVCEADKHKAMEMYTVSKLGMEEREEGSPPLNPFVLSCCWECNRATGMLCNGAGLSSV
ncbi:uncharacterized protein HaLaN_26763, partial [Haematococcus lacustris]